MNAAAAPASSPRPHHRRAALVVTGLVIVLSAVGGLSTDTGSAWYEGLDLPSWQPPGWVFGPVWTILYALLARSAYLAWRDVDGPRRTPILALYLVNGVLNLAWTALFFRAHAPVAAGIEIVVLFGTIVALIILMWPFSRQAAWALVPYGAWVGFASVLTWAIAVAN